MKKGVTNLFREKKVPDTFFCWWLLGERGTELPLQGTVDVQEVRLGPATRGKAVCGMCQCSRASASKASASARKRRSSSSCGLCLSIQFTARSNHVRASSRCPRRQ
jgi:hypothetical protein